MREHKHINFQAAVLLLIAGLFTAAPAAAAVNPFMDVPQGHWAYDAIGMLEANGVISGYPGGAYKGGQLVTRYEMASGLVRALALADMAKAGKEDAEVLARLASEFEDEFYALGLRAGDISDRLPDLDSGPDGWFISGALIMDAQDWDSRPQDGEISLTRARVNFDRWFGERREIHFHAAIQANAAANGMDFESFYAEFPLWSGAYMTAGRFSWDFEGPYNFNTGGISDLGVGSFITDRDYDGLGLTQRFTLGSFQTYIQRIPENGALGYDALETGALARLQFTEMFGMDLGAQYFHGDGASVYMVPAHGSIPFGERQYKFNKLWNLFAGLRFNFTGGIALNGIYYRQDADEEYSNNNGLAGTWEDEGFDAKAYRISLSFGQELLGFTSLWLGCDFTEAGFITLSGDGEFVFDAREEWVYDMRALRVGAAQQWNDKWRTWVYFAYHTLPDAADDGGGVNGVQWGAGIEYRLNPHVAFALSYVKKDFDEYSINDGVYGGDDHLIRFRTQIDF